MQEPLFFQWKLPTYGRKLKNVSEESWSAWETQGAHHVMEEGWFPDPEQKPRAFPYRSWHTPSLVTWDSRCRMRIGTDPWPEPLFITETRNYAKHVLFGFALSFVSKGWWANPGLSVLHNHCTTELLWLPSHVETFLVVIIEKQIEQDSSGQEQERSWAITRTSIKSRLDF